MLPPAAIDYALRSAGFDGVLIAGCSSGDCQHRYGDRWTLERIQRERPPMLRERVPRERLAVCWQRRGEHDRLNSALAGLRGKLAAAAAEDRS
jgi:coenzyme F420-reducing hydrogenase delta subunit